MKSTRALEGARQRGHSRSAASERRHRRSMKHGEAGAPDERNDERTAATLRDDGRFFRAQLEKLAEDECRASEIVDRFESVPAAPR